MILVVELVLVVATVAVAAVVLRLVGGAWVMEGIGLTLR